MRVERNRVLKGAGRRLDYVCGTMMKPETEQDDQSWKELALTLMQENRELKAELRQREQMVQTIVAPCADTPKFQRFDTLPEAVYCKTLHSDK